MDFGGAGGSMDSMMGQMGQQKKIEAYGKVANDVIQFVGDMFAFDATTKSYQYQMAQADENARIAAAAARDALVRGGLIEGSIRMRGSAMNSEARAAFAASGIDASSGTAADIQATTTTMSEFDAHLAQNNTLREAMGYRLQQKRFQEERSNLVDEWSAKNAQYSLNQIGTMIKFGFDAASAGGEGG